MNGRIPYMPGKTQPDDNVPARDPEQLRNLLLVLEHARADAWLRKDKTALEAMLDSDFLQINTSGRFTRDDLLLRLFPRITLSTFTIEDPALIVTGDTTAILTYQCYEELTLDTKKKKSNSIVSALYRWNGKRWKLALWQITPVCCS
jgi:hypothetical protein